MKKRIFFNVIASLFGSILFPVMLFAATGGIDSTNYQSRLCSNEDCSTYTTIYWRTTNGTAVSVSSTALTGYIWSSELGWINLSPTNGGVSNTTSGVLSGYAWGSTAGWINFSPTNGGVTINPTTGDFSGWAWSSTGGWIRFDCSLGVSACVNTAWRPTSSHKTTPPPPGPTPTPTPDPVPTPTPDPTPDPTPTPDPIPTPEPLPVPAPEPGPAPEPTPVPSPTPTPDPVPTPGPSPISIPPIETITKKIEIVGDTVTKAAVKVKTILNSDLGTQVTRAVTEISAVGTVAITVATGIFLNPIALSDLVLIPFRLISLLLSALGFTKRKKPWGVVYDSVTKQPLDPVYVILRNSEGVDMGTAITDLDGRYGFVVPEPGNYMLIAHKTNYLFPSQKLVGYDHDELYRDLYFGEYFAVASAGEVIHRNIPMDPERFDWNEFQKRKQNLMKFYTNREKWLARISNVFFITGFTVSLLTVLSLQSKTNIIIFSVYIVLFFIRKAGLHSRPYGQLKTTSGDPIPFAIIRVSQTATGVEVIHRVSDKIGRYYCLLPNGQYNVRVDRKLPDGSYETIASALSVTVTKGYLSEVFALDVTAVKKDPLPVEQASSVTSETTAQVVQQTETSGNTSTPEQEA